MILLTRNDFREAVFSRDGYKCVVCGASGKLDAHHLIERRLWDNGGYYIENGVSLCGDHHLQAESTHLSVEYLRERAGIMHTVIPYHMYDDQVYDKWGNIILDNGQRLKGELFFDESVQKVIAPFLHLFVNYVKYPRTMHFPWSQGIGKDDRIISSLNVLRNSIIVATVKMDGENTTIYADGYCHARSIDSKDHPSRHWVKNLASRISYELPSGWRICGENLFAKHTVHYTNLLSYFNVFSIWNERNECLSWHETQEWSELLGLETVPVIYHGEWNDDQNFWNRMYTPMFLSNRMEGYVVRIEDSFSYGNFRNSVAKFVERSFRRDIDENKHGHWMRQVMVKNVLQKD